MRRLKVVARLALIALLALVAVPGSVGSRAPSPPATMDLGLFKPVEIAALLPGTVMTVQPQDPGARSAGTLDEGSNVIEPAQRPEPSVALLRPAQRAATPGSVRKVVPKATRMARTTKGGSSVTAGWHHDGNISWYGPGLYGHGTACGQTLTKGLVGVAHRTLPCGTLVTFRYKGVTVTVPVIDRGPYVSGRTWDLSHGACAKLNHCFTGTIDWKLASR